MKKLLVNLLTIVLPVMLFIWLGWSFIDVLAHQDCGGTTNALNFFVLLTSLIK